MKRKRERMITDEDYGRNLNSDPLPVDLMIEILTRLPVKSLLRFLCLSKFWASLIRRPDFVKSSSRPRLLFTFTLADKFVFFSAPHPRNSDKESLSYVAKYDMARHSIACKSPIPVRSLLFCGPPRCPMICNPHTKQLVTLPRVEVSGNKIATYFGYDPINDEYKVLCIRYSLDVLWSHPSFGDCMVLTLGTNQSWRTIEGFGPHYPATQGLCLNGVLYYGARCFDVFTGNNCLLASFDVRSEKFSVIEVPEQEIKSFWAIWQTLINYKGKLACVSCARGGIIFPSIGISMWVLEDAGKHKWSNKVWVFPSPWIDSAGNTELSFAGDTGTGEIILAPSRLSSPFCIFYYNLETKTSRRVEIEGLAEEAFMLQYALRGWDLRISTDYVESIELL